MIETKKRIIPRIFILFLIIDVIFAGVIIYKLKTDIQWVVDIKYAMFTNFTSDRVFFNSPPQGFKYVGFKEDSSDAIRQWSDRIKNNVYYMQKASNDIVMPSEIEKAKFIVLLFSKNGGWGCSADISLLNKLQKLPEGNGYGCCTDHSEAFIVYSSMFGLIAREVHTVGHVTNEFFDMGLNKWIWIDPLFTLLAKNKKGEYLSLIEMRDSYYKNEPVIYDFFGNYYHLKDKKDPYGSLYYDSKDDFEDIMVTWGNNVFEEERFNHNLFFLHKMIRQFIGITAGITPSYLKYVDDNNAKTHVRYAKVYIYGAFLILIIGNTLYPCQVMIGFLMKQRRR